MTAQDFHQLRSHVQWSESSRLKPYLDCCGKPWRKCTCAKKGKLTIGYGRNLDDYGITTSERDLMLDHNLHEGIGDLSTFPWFHRLSGVRQVVLADMRFNLGYDGFRKFRKLIAALERNDVVAAAKEMTASRWYRQVGRRSKRLVQMWETDAYAA
jgi:lysozyme